MWDEMPELPPARARPRRLSARLARAIRFHVRRAYYEARAVARWRVAQAFAVSLACTTVIALRFHAVAETLEPIGAIEAPRGEAPWQPTLTTSDIHKAAAAQRIVDAFGAALPSRWRTGLRCPTAFEVADYTRYSAFDPWGMPLVVVCTTDCEESWFTPRGHDGRGGAGPLCHHAVFSAGPDGVTWTKDDIHSRNWSASRIPEAHHPVSLAAREDPLY